MSNAAILAPVFVQVLIVYIVLALMVRARAQSMRTTRTRMDDPKLALGKTEWSAAATQTADNFRNQFEMPVLFFAVVAFAMLTRSADLIFVVLSWAFVAVRAAHMLVQTTFNTVTIRMPVFALSAAILAALWIKLALHIFTA